MMVVTRDDGGGRRGGAGGAEAEEEEIMGSFEGEEDEDEVGVLARSPPVSTSSYFPLPTQYVTITEVHTEEPLNNPILPKMPYYGCACPLSTTVYISN